MKQEENQVSFRSDIKVVDCTVRDGGLVNDFYFSDDFIRNLYHSNINAGIDYMEFGYKASKDLFDVNKFGKWKFCEEKDIRSIVGNNDSELKISVMADVGRTDYKKDILKKEDSVIDMIRIATYINTIPEAVEMIDYCNDLGYETTVNVMAISSADESELDRALELLGNSKANVIYLVDSYGSLYPEQAKKLAQKYLKVGEKYNKYIGIHAHNNQQLAFANTIETAGMGVSYLDATMNSMGRGAGNCSLELLIGFLKNPKYKLQYILKFIEEDIQKLKQEGVYWGYDIPYLLTGKLNQHPREAIQFITEKRKDFSNFYEYLL